MLWRGFYVTGLLSTASFTMGQTPTPAYVRFTATPPLATPSSEREACSSTICYALSSAIGLLLLVALAVFVYYFCTRRKTRVEFRLTERDVDTSPSIDLGAGIGKCRVLVGGQTAAAKDPVTRLLSSETRQELESLPIPSAEIIAEVIRDWPNPTWWITAMIMDLKRGPLHLPFGTWGCVGVQAGGVVAPSPTGGTTAATSYAFQLRLQPAATSAPSILQIRRDARAASAASGLSSGSEGEGRPSSSAGSVGPTSASGSCSESSTSGLVPFRSQGAATDPRGPFVLEGFISRESARFVARKSYTTATHLEFGVAQFIGDELCLSGRWMCLKPTPSSGFAAYHISMPPPIIVTSTVSNASITSAGNGSFAKIAKDRIDSPLLRPCENGSLRDDIEI